MTAVLDIRAIEKRFGGVRALRGVSFSARAGERIALLGHNGAGKTTLFRLILGFLRPDAGAINIGAGRPGDDAARLAISYLPENVAFQKNLTGRETVDLFARLKRTSQHAALDALDRVGLSDAASRRVGTYSKGMRQRLGLAIAALGAPKLILLDEPTSGLDPQSRADFYSYFRELSGAGATILFSSHTLNDINGNADRIVILKSGALVGDGTELELRAAAGLPVIFLVHTRDSDASAVAARLGGRVSGSGRVEISCRPEDKMTMLARTLAERDAVLDVEFRDPSLMDIYRAYSAEKMQP